MTTTTKDQRTETLAQFSAQLDAHLDRPSGFIQAVHDLAVARARLKRLNDRRSAIYREMESRHQMRGGGAVILPPSRSGERWVLRRTASKASVVRTVPAEVVRKADLAAYERARVTKAKVQLSTPATWASGADDKLPGVPGPRLDIDQVVSMYRSKHFDVLKSIRDDEDDARLRLDKIAADCGWDGGETHGPMLFSDGWKIGLRSRVYDSERLKVVEPELYERLAVTKTRNTGTRLMVVDFDTALSMGFIDEADLDDEFDEIDGE